MKKNTIVATLFGITLGLAGTALAQPDKGMPERGERAGQHARAGNPMAAMLKQLDLSDDQKAQAKALKEGMKDERSRQRAARQQISGKIMAQLSSGSPDAKQLHELIEARSKLETEAAHERIDAMMQIMETLTPEQREKLAELAQQRMERVQQGQQQREQGSATP